MKSYKYLRICTGGGYTGGIQLVSTDSQVLDWIFAEVRKFFPGCAVRNKKELPSGETFACNIHRLKDRDWEVCWWIIKQLCLQGWEPFAFHCEPAYDATYHLRLEVADNGEGSDGLLP